MNYLYVAKIVSEHFHTDLLRNFSVEIRNVRYIVTKGQDSQSGFVEWGNKKIYFEMREERYLFICTDKKEDVMILEKVWQYMCGDKHLKLGIQRIPKGFFVGEYFSPDITDFEFTEEGLQADLWIEGEEIFVVYDKFGYLIFSVTTSSMVMKRVIQFAVDFLRKIDKK